MKKIFSIILLVIINTVFVTNTYGCILYIYTDKFNNLGQSMAEQIAPPEKFVQITAISTDNKYQYTSALLRTGQDTSFNNIECGERYNIYAQIIDGGSKIEPFGDYTYIANGLEVNGNLPIYFPSRFEKNRKN